jgi:cation transport regulator
MPYTTNEDLPASICKHLPAPAQSVYRKAFNRAWEAYGLDAQREQIAHRIAWSAVKRHWHKGVDGYWEPGGTSDV